MKDVHGYGDAVIQAELREVWTTIRDVVWAARSRRDTTSALLDIVILANSEEFVSPRLLLAGYEAVSDAGNRERFWRSPLGQLIKVVELDEPWALDLFVEAGKKRDAEGVRHVTFPYAVLYLLEHGDGDVVETLSSGSTDLKDAARELVRSRAPELLATLDRMTT